MAAALPEVTACLVGLLRELGHDDLAASLPTQFFHGRCGCRPGCSFVLTAPPEWTGTAMIWLEVCGKPIGQASLDLNCQLITNFEIDQPDLINLPLNWLDLAVYP
ncbi:hypothetical protein AB0M47_11775 [Hamadaea sp. NPDC051192]|uniref:hypothetical protein n=1 Tax=Hamadaea sp. NPDC051192 TaxID=3154940 RepID=UPI00343735D7